MHVNLKLNGDWPSVSHLLKKHYPLLSENDLHFERGGEVALVERISGKLRMPQEEIWTLLLKLKIQAASPAEAV